MQLCWTWFYVISGAERLIPLGPEYERCSQIGLNNYEYYVCKLRGLSAFSGELDSLLGCVRGVGEAGASYMNKWFNCNQELFLVFPSPEVRYRLLHQDARLSWNVKINKSHLNHISVGWELLWTIHTIKAYQLFAGMDIQMQHHGHELYQ